MKLRHIFILLTLCLSVFAVEAKVRVACVGNSITAGYGLENPARDSYPSVLQQMLGEEYEVGNFGHSGATLIEAAFRPYVQQTAYRNALHFAADIVVIHLGLNDTDPRSWPNYRDHFLADYLCLIDSFKQVNKDAKVYVCKMTPIFDRHRRFKSGTRDWFWMEQDAISLLPRLRDVELIDLHSPLHNRPDLFADALHPSEEGAKIIAQTVFSALTGNYGGLHMSPMYSDNMVLQRGKQVKISGHANAGEKVTVSVDKYAESTIADSRGKWQVAVDDFRFPKGPFTLKIATRGKELRYNNVALGDVWLCSGQSNMAFMVKEAAADEVEKFRAIAKDKNNGIRVMDMKPRWETNVTKWSHTALDSVNSLQYYHKASWQCLDAGNVDETSAIAVAFAHYIEKNSDVPVGIIVNAVGGSGAESWIDRRTLEHEFPDILKDWRRNDFVMDWVRGRASLNVANNDAPLQRHPYEPAYLFEAGIEPLDKYPLKGVIWYQGESNAHNVEVHEQLMPLLVKSWRNNWEANLPFHYVQLSSLNRPSWPHFRDSQRQLASKIDNATMTVCSDLGDSLNVHPRRKMEVGRRLALQALKHTYGMNHIVASGPEIKDAEFFFGEVWLEYDNAEGLGSCDGAPLRTFELAEVDGLYFPANAEVIDGKVSVWSEHVRAPKYVRYGWEPYSHGNLVNAQTLPASTMKIAKQDDNAMWNSLPDLPMGAPKKLPIGVSAPYAGIIDGTLIVAGGCNFPDIPAAAGGTKAYYKDVYALTPMGWKKVGEMPAEMAYGGSVTTPDGIVCIGGNNSKSSSKSVFIIKMPNGKAKIESLPALPVAIDNTSATYADGVVYVAGGNEDGKASHSLYALSLKDKSKKWKRLSDFPGSARVQPVLAAIDGKLYLAGGFQPIVGEDDPQLPTDVLVYDIVTDTWSKETELPLLNDGSERTLTGGCAVTFGDEVLMIGGVNRQCFYDAVRRPLSVKEAQAAGDESRLAELHKAAANYMHYPAQWYQFNTELIAYSPKAKRWRCVGDYEQLARAGAAAVINGDSLIIVNGELKPGIRTPQVNSFKLKETTLK